MNNLIIELRRGTINNLKISYHYDEWLASFKTIKGKYHSLRNIFYDVLESDILEIINKEECEPSISSFSNKNIF